MRRQIMKTTVMLLCMISLLVGGGKSVAYAKTGQPKTSFSGDVTMLKQENNGYVMQVTVENRGEDFTGTVQLIFASSGYDNCAYNTEITLPAQGKKQFTINVSDRAVDTMRGLCALNFLDEKGNVVQSISLKNVFGNTMSGIPVGILSDNYSGLTFMDAGGQDFDIRGKSSPLRLIELNNDNLGEYLNGLYFLIIDRFNVSSLSEENIQAIQEWVNGGGWLLIGTGEYAEQTLSGFDEDFIDVDVSGVSEPGQENTVSVNADKYGYYYNYADDGVDFTNIAVADLNYNRMNGYLYGSTENPAICGSFEEGAVSIFFCSLGDKELQKLGNYEIRYIYEELMYQSDSYSVMGYSELEYVGQKSLAVIDNVNTDVNFTWLKVIIIVYVVLVGPVLYLILRKCKKREWYWICAPVLGILFIAGVFLLGQGVRVNETRVYSVTAQRVDGNRADTYFLAYHSGVKPWVVRLNDNYEVAGPGLNGYYRVYNQSTDDYYYIVDNDSEGLSVGIKPEENFESGFLYAAGRTESRGTISCGNLKGTGGNVSGTVTNGTDCDMSYIAVWLDSYIMVVSDVKAGETIDLQQAVQDGRCVYENSVSYYDDLLYSMLSVYSYQSNVEYERDDLAALLIGLGIADGARPAGHEQAVIAGVVRDYDKAVAGKCNETSYGCLYSYAEMGEEQNASN